MCLCVNVSVFLYIYIKKRYNLRMIYAFKRYLRPTSIKQAVDFRCFFIKKLLFYCSFKRREWM